MKSWAGGLFIVMAISVGCSSAAHGAKETAMVQSNFSDKDLRKMIGQSVTLVGKAMDAKAGAVLKTTAGLVYIRELDAWPEDLNGKDVSATGILQRKEAKPGATRTHEGQPRQGIEGGQWILEQATWKLFDPAKIGTLSNWETHFLKEKLPT